MSRAREERRRARCGRSAAGSDPLERGQGSELRRRGRSLELCLAVATVFAVACGAAGEKGPEETRDGVAEGSRGEPGVAVEGEARSLEESTGDTSQILSAARGEGEEGPAGRDEAKDGGADAPSGEEHSAGEASLAGGADDTVELADELAEAVAPEAAPKSRVVVRMTDSKGQVDREVIRRVVAHVAQTCHRRALRRDPAVVGRFSLKFRLHGDYKGPKSLLIDGRESYPQLASCLRREMDRTRWPTGHLCGVGLFEANVDFSVVDAS